MPRITVESVGAIGVIKDLPPHELPDNAWSNANNFRFQDIGAKKGLGYQSLGWNTPVSAPYYLVPVQTSSAFYWLYCGLNSIYAVQSAYSFDITRASGGYNASALSRWTATDFNGIPVLNNGIDTPQFWPFSPSQSNILEDLPGFPTTDRPKVIRAYKNYLVALNINRSGTTYDRLVKWSDSADIGLVPASWAIDDPTLDGGESTLPEDGGAIVDALPLRDSLMIYRDNSVYRMQFTQGNDIFRFDRGPSSIGLLAVGCVTDFFGKHLLITKEDIVLFDGQNAQSIVDSRNRRQFFSELSSDYYDQSYIVHNRNDKEVWLCYPQSGDTYPTKAMVWSYAEGSWAFRTFPALPHMAYGIIDQNAQDSWEPSKGNWQSQVSTWAAASGTWSTADIAWSADDRPWNGRTYDVTKAGILGADATNMLLYQMDLTNQANGAAQVSFLERAGINLGENRADMIQRKTVRSIYPHITGDSGAILKVKVGGRDSIGQSVSYATEQSFTIGSQYKCDFTVDGRLIDIRFSSAANNNWTLHSYQIDVDMTGDA
jgi:hypothetical protein